MALRPKAGVVAEHLPVRPSWVCSVCGQPWPCHTARADLVTEYADARTALAVYLARTFLECVADQPDVPSGELYPRFLGWWRPRQPARAPDPAIRATEHPL
jgi:hypothetical protein